MKILTPIIFLSLFGCACNAVVLDPSPNAVAANDFTVASTLNNAMPGAGADILRVKEGSPIKSYWTLVLPAHHKGGEAAVQYNDITKTYGIKEGQTQLDIPLQDLFSHTAWLKTDAALMVVFVNILYDTKTGLATTKARGFGLLIVTDSNYDPLPIDSGYITSITECKVIDVAYTTAGRSNIKCK